MSGWTIDGYSQPYGATQAEPTAHSPRRFLTRKNGGKLPSLSLRMDHASASALKAVR